MDHAILCVKVNGSVDNIMVVEVDENGDSKEHGVVIHDCVRVKIVVVMANYENHIVPTKRVTDYVDKVSV